MAPETGGSQISALPVPGIARVLRSPVADAIVNMIHAGAGLEPFRKSDADELIQFAVRRGLISVVEGERLMSEIRAAGRRKRASKPATKKASKKPKKPAAKKKAKKAVKQTATKAKKRKATKQPARKPAKRARRR